MSIDKKNTLTIGLVQQQCTNDKTTNLELSSQLISQLAKQKTELVLLQELHSTPYFCQQADPINFELAESIPGPTTNTLSQLAKQFQVVIVGSIFERRTNGIYHNTAVVIDKDGSIAGQYRKMHIPDDPGYQEKYYFTPGDSNGFQPIQTSLGKLGVLVCWDQWFPEAARLMALAGADILLYPTAIGWNNQDEIAEQQHQLDAWVTIQRSHAIANCLPIIVANRVGFEQDPKDNSTGIQFWGNSFIAGPQGEIIAQANNDDCIALCANIDMYRSEKVRQLWPFFRDRRIDAYQHLLKRHIV